MSRVLLAAGLAVVVSTAAYAATLPVKVLNAQQAAQLGAYTQVPLSGANFSTSALISVQSKAKTLTDVKRNGPAVSAAYAGVSAFPISPPPTPVTSAAPPSSEVFNFKLAGDSAQGWATTTPQGMPFLFTQAYGQSVAAGTASWRAQVTVTAQSPNLYVQFMLPAAQVTGVTEENGPSNWQSRLRADLQLNGHPVWSSEASRISLLNGQASSNDNCFEHDEKAQYLSTFGQGLGFTPAANVNSTARSSSSTPTA